MNDLACSFFGKNQYLVILVLVFFFIAKASANEPILVIPNLVVSNEKEKLKIDLGKKLFEDKALSQNNSVACMNCHNLHHGGVDGLVKSIGVSGAIGDINSPTVFNSGFNFRQFWDGRARTLEDQIDGPINHPNEMGSNWADVVQKLKADAQYMNSFAKVYSDGITPENIKNAIATFERTLVTPNSRFDRYLRGDVKAISELEKSGYQKFKSYGCIACHQGMNVGGNMFQTMGVMGNYFADRGTPITDADLGRYKVTKNESDKYVFRVPSLRNIELTAPYFHDGSAKTLEQAVLVMAKYQLGLKLSSEDVKAIVAFLKTLTGETPATVKASGQ